MLSTQLLPWVFFIFSHASQGAAPTSFRLPKTAIPSKYRLEIAPNLSSKTYQGEVEIDLALTKPVDEIILHSKKLTITSVSLRTNEKTIDVTFEEYIPYNFLIIKSQESLAEGLYQLEITYKGIIGDDRIYGFYYGFDYDGAKPFAGTFFEPINARTAFPCFDEPFFKAKFTVNVTVAHNFSVISNTPIYSVTLDEDHKRYRFQETPTMASYLVSWFIHSTYSFVTNTLQIGGRKIETRVYAVANKIKRAKFAIEEIPRQLKWYMNYTDFEYPIDKLDYIAVNPKFHMDGGMEDWGAISVRETELLYDPETDTTASEAHVSLTIAHEMAHMWFGDLVTMDFWDEFWLNEGFARLFNSKISVIYPQYRNTLSRRVSEMQSIMRDDDDVKSTPLVRKMTEPIEVYDILNEINYGKGASILFMTDYAMGKANFQKAIRSYLKKYQYKTVTTKRWIGQLQNFANFNVTDYMDSWTLQPGYPLLTVEVKEGNTVVEIRQKRFLRMNQTDLNGARWTIPIFYISDHDQEEHLFWFSKDTPVAKLHFPRGITWVKLNHRQKGYFRVKYPTEMSNHFLKNISSLEIEDRMELIDTAFALLRSSDFTCAQTLAFTEHLKNEMDHIPWQAVMDGFRQISVGLEKNHLTTEHLKNYVKKLIDKPYREQNWNELKTDSHLEKTNRYYIIDYACHYGHPDCLARAKELYPSADKLGPNMKSIVRKFGKPRTKRNMQELSRFFGADLTKLVRVPPFEWPKNVVEECNDWFREKLAVPCTIFSTE